MPDTHNIEEQPKRAKAYGDSRQTADDKPGTLEEQLADAQNALTVATQQVAVQQSLLRDLQAAVTDIQQAAAGFDDTLQRRLEDESTDIGDKLGQIDLSQPVKDKIKEVMADFDLQPKADAVTAAKIKKDKTAGDVTTADTVLQQKASELDEEKKLPKTIDGTLKTVKSMLDLAGKFLTQKDFVSGYFLLTDANNQLTAAQTKEGVWHGPIPDADQYSKDIHEKEQVVFKAKRDLAGKKDAATVALKAYTDAQQAYDAASKSRQSDILTALKGVHATEASKERVA